MSDLKVKVLATLDELLFTAKILLKNLAVSDWDNGDSAFEAISVMLLQLLEFYGPEHLAAQQLFPVMDRIQTRIRFRNYIGARLDAEYLIKALKEMRTLVENTTEP